MNDFIKELKVQLNDRVTNPLVACFVISWVLWNWSVLLAIFFGTGYNERLQIIESSISHSGNYYLSLWLYPLLSALAYILIYPWVSRGVYWYWENQQKQLKLLRQKIEDETPITQEEAVRLRRTNREAIRALEEEIDETQKRVQELQLAVAERDQKCSKLETEKIDLLKQLGKATELVKTELKNSREALSGIKNQSNEKSSVFAAFDTEAVDRAKQQSGISDDGEMAAFLALVSAHSGSTSQLAETTGINRIIIENGINVLDRMGLVENYGSKWHLTDRAKQIVVATGLVKL